MPVAKSKTSGTDVSAQEVRCCPPHHGGALWCGESSHHHFGRKILMTIFGVLLAYLVIFVGTLIRNNLRQQYFIGRAPIQEHTIRVEAEAKVVAKPDVAITNIGMISEGKTVADAQKKNTDVMNALIEKLKGFGVAPADIQTDNYTISPQYTYTQEKGQQLVGYQVSQGVTVKIRDLEKANTILGVAGEVGANSVSGLRFTIDDRDVYVAEARQKAMEKVAEKAKNLSESLGVRLTTVVSYDEFEPGGTGGPVMFNAYAKDTVSQAMSAPTIESGSLDVVLAVAVTFAIR